jgi:hypothetical protein
MVMTMSPSEVGAGVVDGRGFADELTPRERLVDAVSAVLWEMGVRCDTCSQWDGKSCDGDGRRLPCDVCSWWSEREHDGGR